MYRRSVFSAALMAFLVGLVAVASPKMAAAQATNPPLLNPMGVWPGQNVITRPSEPLNPTPNPLTPNINPINPNMNPVNPNINPVNPNINPVAPNVNPIMPGANPVAPYRNPINRTAIIRAPVSPTPGIPDLVAPPLRVPITRPNTRGDFVNPFGSPASPSNR
jgi:hypothetical protein